MYTLDDILTGTGGTVDPEGMVPDDMTFTDVVIDSRQATPGSLFVALAGQAQDGHEFVMDALGHGARGLLVQAGWQPPLPTGPGVAVIRVADTLAALQAWARHWRGRFAARVVGITGSIGKTSTKEVTAAVLARRFNVLKSPGNLNSQTGLPLSVLRLTPETQVAVFEMGGGEWMGEITRLAEIAQPEVGVITNVSYSHLANMGTMDRLAEHKAELVRALGPTSTAILNADDPYVIAMRAVAPGRVLTYGLDPSADLWADEIESQGLNGVQFTLHTGTEDLRIRLPLLGAHSVHTALRAAATGVALGMNWRDILDGLQTLDQQQLRLLVVPGVNQTTLIDDSYNANPASSLAALNLLNEMPGAHVAVLGDMLELGDYEREGHVKVARRAVEVVERLVVVGPLGRIIGEEALVAGMSPDRVFFAATNAQAVDHLRRVLAPGSYVLIKGSHGVHMEEVVEGLRAK
jgi:UDP-N-acetylmuramoyl-tripeptide--D-alanyl-D-alanine ligase